MEAFEWEEREDATPFTVHMIGNHLLIQLARWLEYPNIFQ